MENTSPVSLEQLQKQHGSYFRLVLEAQMYPVDQATSPEDATERNAKLQSIYKRIFDTLKPERQDIKTAYAGDEDAIGRQIRTLNSDAIVALSKVVYLQAGVVDGDSLQLAELALGAQSTPASVNWQTKVLSEWVDLAYQGKTVTAPSNVGYNSALAGVEASIEYLLQPDAFVDEEFDGSINDIAHGTVNTLIETQQKLQDMGCYTPNVKARA